MNYPDKIDRIRKNLAKTNAAGVMLTTTDHIYYATGLSSVMDGWQLIEPIGAVFIPLDSALPVTLFMPEASLISLVISERSGSPVFYDRIRTYDMLNFCETARAQDAHLSLPADLASRLETISALVDDECAHDIMIAIERHLVSAAFTEQLVLFDDLRVATRLESSTGQSWGDALDVMLSARSIKTADEIALFEQSGLVADRIIEHTVSQLGIGKRWSDVENSVAKFMIDEGVDPLPGSPMLFGGAYDLVFRPDLFRTKFDRPFQGGEIAILETQGRYQGFWIDINRTAHIGEATPAYREQHQILMDIYATLVERLKPGANTADISRIDNIPSTQRLSAPSKLLVVAHSVGLLPLESPVRYPGTGWHAAKDGFTVKSGMIISIDCLYFGSKLGPSHIENVFVVTESGSYSIYATPLDLIEVT